MVSRLRTPVRERPQAKFPSSSKKSIASESPVRKKTVLSVIGETSVGQEAASVSRPTVRRKLLCPLEKDSSMKNATLWRKNLLKQLKNEKCWKIVTEESKRLYNRTGQRCSNCHYRNHTVRSCQMEKCESVFFVAN